MQRIKTRSVYSIGFFIIDFLFVIVHKVYIESRLLFLSYVWHYAQRKGKYSQGVTIFTAKYLVVCCMRMTESLILCVLK